MTLILLAMREIRCCCGAWLAEIELSGRAQRYRLRPCEDCQRAGRACYPTVFVRQDGCYAVELLRGPVGVELLPWPRNGWRG